MMNLIFRSMLHLYFIQNHLWD